MQILIRADSSSSIGTGHIMRDLVLAKQYKNAHITFASQNLNGNINNKILSSGYNLKVLQTNTFEELSAYIEEIAFNLLIIDNYAINHLFEKQIKTHHPMLQIMVVDDTYERHHCDILLNHNIYADSKKYLNLVPKNCVLKCGSKYTLLRQEFIEERKAAKKKKAGLFTVFLVMGGSDIQNLNPKIVDILSNFPSVILHIITTQSNPYLEELKLLIHTKKWITLHINSQNMAQLLRTSDLAILTPSVTMNEVWYMEIPFISIQVAKNQKFMQEFLQKNKRDVLNEFNTIMFEKLFKKHMHSGVTLQNFLELSTKESQMILEWRNNDNIRTWMDYKEIISIKEHQSFMKTLSETNEKVYFLVRKDKILLGVIDFIHIDKKNSSAEMGLYSKPQLKGLGYLLMREILFYAFHTLKIHTIYARIRPDNDKAISLYKKFNFKQTKKDEKFITMEYTR